MKIRFPTLFMLFAMPAVTPLMANEQPGEPDGQQLFSQYGCSGCHGEEGIHPTSKYAPVLKGKPADYLLQGILALVDGAREPGSPHFTPDRFCASETQVQDCSPTPSHVELEAIASWLGSSASPGKKKSTISGLYMSSSEAYKKLQKWGEKALFIDVRTRAEVAFVGMPTMVNANIPYMLTDGFNQWNDRKQTFQLKRNRDFVSDVGKLIDTRGLSKESPIILICRSGSRSAKAANILFAAGFTKVYTITDGFEGDKAKSGPRKGERVVNGWKNAGLPWAYKLNRTAMYWSE